MTKAELVSKIAEKTGMADKMGAALKQKVQAKEQENKQKTQ